MRTLQSLVILTVVYSVHTVRNTRLRRSTSDVDVKELEITSDVRLRYANVLVRSLMVNKKTTDQEVAFQIRLPKEAYITAFLIVTNNRTIKAEIKEKKKAQEEYDKAKKDNVTAGLVSQQGVRDDLDVDIFRIEVNVAANAEVEFQLEYEEFLRRHAGKYTQAIFIDSPNLIPQQLVKCSFKEKQRFTVLSSKAPYNQQDIFYDEASVTEDGFYVKTLEWTPMNTSQDAVTAGLDKPFVTEYELELDETGGMLFLNNYGDFVYLFSVPCVESKIMAKQIVFVIDISSSMSGNPILQVRQAMESILSQLRPHDYFNIIIFDDEPIKWRTVFQQANENNVNTAKAYVKENVVADGSTNINDALQNAIALFDNADKRSGQIIIFLTDGSPTAGVTDTNIIRRNVRSRNYIGGEKCCKSTINTIAFGRYAVISFLQMIAYENAGTLTIIKDIESVVADRELITMYEEVKNPYFKNLVFSFEVENEVLPARNVTRTQYLQHDCGSEIAVTGLAEPGKPVYPTVKVVGALQDEVFNSVPTVLIVADSQMLSRLAAYQWIKELLRKVDTSLDEGIRNAYRREALDLSLKYGFVTPLTSLVVVDYPTADQAISSMDFEVYGKVLNSQISNCPMLDCNGRFCLFVCLIVLLFFMSK